MIKLWLENLSLQIDSDRLIDFESPSFMDTAIEYSIVGIAIARGVQYESKFLWQGIQVLLTQSQLNTLTLIKFKSDNLRRDGEQFGIGFLNTVFPFTEETRTRAIAPNTEEIDNDDGSVTYFPQFAVAIVNVKASILGDLRPTTFDLVELEKVLAES